MKKKLIMLGLIVCSLFTTMSAKAVNVTYTNMGVPNIQSYFKTWMDYRCITDKSSPQYNLVNNVNHNWIYTDEEGFLRAIGETDLGIPEDYYVIALGSYYGTTITNKYKITMDTGRVFYGILGDQKADIHTNSTNQYARNNDVVEFIVDSRILNKKVKQHGSANVYMPLNGNIAKIEKISFIW